MSAHTLDVIERSHVLDVTERGHTIDQVEQVTTLEVTTTVLPGQPGTWVALTQAAYNALGPNWDPNVLYLIIN